MYIVTYIQKYKTINSIYYIYSRVYIVFMSYVINTILKYVIYKYICYKYYIIKLFL